MFEWVYLVLRGDGTLVYEDGQIANSYWPRFADTKAAEEWLVENDIRATLK